MDSVEERVISIVAEQLGVSKEQVTPETSFINDLGADSLDTVELVMELEEEFGISIPDDAADKIQTVGQVIDYIKKVQDGTTPSPRSPSPRFGEEPAKVTDYVRKVQDGTTPSPRSGEEATR